MVDTAEYNWTLWAFQTYELGFIGDFGGFLPGSEIKFTLTNNLTRIVYQTEVELISKFIENFGVKNL